MRIEPKPSSEYPSWIRLILRAQKTKYGAPLEPTRLWGRSPKVFFGVQTLFRMLERRSSPIEAVLRSLVMVRVSQLNHCAFCIDANSASLQKRGVDEDKIAELPEFRTSALFTDREKSALEYAEAMTRSDQRVDEELFSRLKKLFDDDALIDLTALIAYQNMSSKFNAALDVPSQGFCLMPPASKK